MLCTQITEKLMVNKFVLALVLEFNFYFSYQDYWTEESMLECGEPHSSATTLWRGLEHSN
jgi:hypothetical protein